MSEWTTQRLEKIIQVNPTVKLTKGKVYPFIDIDKVSPTLRSVTNEEVKTYDGQSCSKFCNGDTVFSRITPCLENRKIAKVSINGQAAFGSTEFYIFRAKEGKSDENFVYYLTSSDAVVLPAINSMTGASGRQRADKRFIERTKLNVPELPTQKRIADILSTYDDLIENNNRRIALLEKAAQELYKEWFVRFRFPGHEMATFENGLPKGWVTKKLFDIANVKYGYAFKSDLFCEDETLNPVVRIRDIPNNKTNTFTSEECDEKYIINENAIVIGMDGIFHMCLWNGGKAFLNQRVVEIESKIEDLSNLYLYYALHPQVKYWEQTISGTTVAHLGDKHLKIMTVIMPNEEIAQKATAIFNEIMIQKNILFKQNQNLIKQRDLLLPRLMSGKLEV